MKATLLSTSAMYHPGPRARWIPLARIAHRHGIAAELICLHPNYQQHTHISATIDGVVVTHVAQMHIDKHERALHGTALMTTALRASIRMAQHTIRSQPHVIALCKAQPINGLAAIIAQRRTGATLILDIDDCEHESHLFNHAWQKALVAHVERALPRHAQSTSVASQWHLHQLTRIGHDNLAHIPNGIEYIPSLPLPLSTLPTHYVAYVGRIAFHTHAVDLLIDAIAQTHTTIPLVIAGNGPDVAALHRRITHHRLGTRCIWLGQVSPTTAQQVIAHAHATIDPVRDTLAVAARYPLKIIESLAHGVPVITSAVGDRAEMIGAHGTLIPAGNARALADAIDTYARAPRLPRHAGHARVMHLTWDRVGLRWLDHHRLLPNV